MIHSSHALEDPRRRKEDEDEGGVVFFPRKRIDFRAEAGPWVAQQPSGDQSASEVEEGGEESNVEAAQEAFWEEG